ncbi:ABC transporter permease/M1 family aminopeptidase [Flavobacterium phragmitis]|uniref:Peptidase family M1 n=1 Tax=Flavobacterium phragmitis TaxID=739143 RepID=A0A1I1LZN5_9FLAO|nr:M1 family aminopeptidase [Flavobacterium phragmitis]SFC74910.1 Peptidase family M1 [Flavobacterium phragmitis]
MWYDIFKFEIQYRIKRPETYIFFIFIFFFSLAGVDFVFQGIDMGSVKTNAPIVIAKAMAAVTAILMMVTSLIMGVSVLRDYQYNVESLLFVNPIQKRDYLAGRFLGSFAVLLFVFTGLLLGFALGEFMPWRYPENLMPFNFSAYLQPFITVVLPMLFFGSALFFVSGALSRNLMVVYTQGVLLFVPFLLTKSIKNDFLQALLDPFSLTTLTDMNALFTATERNSMLVPFSGVLLYNKLFWSFLGLLILIIGYFKFDFSAAKNKTPEKKKINTIYDLNTAADENLKISFVLIQYNFKTQFVQLLQLTWFYFISICKQVSFWAIIVCALIIILINSINLNIAYDVASYPKTYLVIKELKELSLYFFAIILIFYSGELIWKEREIKLDLIYGAASISDIIILLGKFLGLLLIYIVLILSLIIFGMAFQTANGWYHHELDVYFYGFFVEFFPFLVLYTFISFFFQALTNNKFTGFIFVMVFVILNTVSEFFGFEHDLYKFAGSGLGSYSDMNGYGHFLASYLWIKAYWIALGILLLILASILSVRGTETSLKKRIELGRQRFTKPLLQFVLALLLVFTLLGSYIFYNTNILNQYQNTAEELKFKADYEKELKRFEYLPQPKITDVKLQVELYPKTRAYTVQGYYILSNTLKEPIYKIYLQKPLGPEINLEEINFGREVFLDKHYNQYGFYIYTLKKALQGGEAVKMKFKQTYTTKGFKENDSNSSVLQNGTFLTNKAFPTLGYSKEHELDDTRIRAEFELPPAKGMTKRNDKTELTYAAAGGSADLINFEVTIGTEKRQKAISSGILQKRWTLGSRSYFHYKTDKPIVNQYAIISADYEVSKSRWYPKNNSSAVPVDLEIYYQKGHQYNVERMIQASKLSFDYFSANYGPYKHSNIRIIETPAYTQQAESFSGAVTFSESNEFMLNIDDQSDVDIILYRTAHELAHQWWGMQLQAANVQGKNMILETLAQYSALMVMKKKYSKEKIEQLLQKEQEVYLQAKKRYHKQEVPLELVEKQDYIFNTKGILVMYALQNYIGEEKVNFALKSFIRDWNNSNGILKSKTSNYPTTKELLTYFIEVTPVSLRHKVYSLFEKTKFDYI